jgi:hypothetical protein
MERINDLLFRRDVRGTNLPFVKWTAKKGAVVPLTHYVTEHVDYESGDIKVIPPDVPPEFVFLRVHPGRYDRHRYLLRLGGKAGSPERRLFI